MLRRLTAGGLRARLVLLVLVTLLPVVAASTIASWQQRSAVLATFQTSSQQTASAIGADLDRVLGVTREIMRLLPTLADTRVPGAACTETLDRFRSVLPNLTDIGIIDGDGSLRCASSGPPPAFVTAEAPWLAAARAARAFTIVGSHELPGSAQRHLLVAHPFALNDVDAGVVYGSMSLEWIAEVLPASGIPRGAVATVYDENGLAVYKSASPGDTVGRRVDPGVLERLRADSLTGVPNAGADGVPRVFSVASFGVEGGNRHLLTVGYTLADAARPFNRTLLAQSLVLALGLLVSLLAVNRVAERLVLGPIEALMDATARVRSGDLQARVQPAGVPELRELEAAFNLTVEALQSNQQMQDQLRRGQRLQAIGQLAGGIAHEFNNMLTVILGHVELLLDEQPDREDYRAIQVAADRSRVLTHQLLAFSRRQVLQPRRSNLDELVRQSVKALTPVLGERIAVELRLSGSNPEVLVDQVQFEHVLLNLFLNAREAMPDGGRLTVSTALVGIRTASVGELPEGRYVEVAIRDTGVGMDADTLAHALEPFFTTKGVGQRSGLGLSTAYGIVRQSGGELTLSSHPSAGTTVRVYLPLSA